MGVSVLAVVALALPMMPAFGTVVVPGTPRSGSLVEVGPVDPVNAFPTWYRNKDATGAMSRPEICLPAGASRRPVLRAAGAARPNRRHGLPTNYPGELFYQMAASTFTNLGGWGGDLKIEMNLEGGYATGTVVDPGQEQVFGRIRIKDVDVPAGLTLRITHPYGIDEVTSVGTGHKGLIDTVDVGAGAGLFGGALGGRVGPFLKWDPAIAPAAPVGYTGDPTVNHAVVGSPYGTNYVKVEQKNADGTYTLLSQTDQFSVQGRYAVNSGLTVDKAVYAQQADGTGTVDVYASSEASQSIQVKANPLGFSTTTLRAEDGRYFAHLPVIGGITPGRASTSSTPVTSRSRPST
jgi:hypothetical protein